MSIAEMRVLGECTTWLSIVSQLFSKRMGKMLEPHAMTVGQFSILHHIARPQLKRGTRISDIAAAVEVDQPAVTKAIAKFENMGLVTLKTNPSDKRAKIVITKPAAIELLDKIRMSIGPELTMIFSGFEMSELQGFTKNLKTLGMWLDNNRLN